MYQAAISRDYRWFPVIELQLQKSICSGVKSLWTRRRWGPTKVCLSVLDKWFKEGKVNLLLDMSLWPCRVQTLAQRQHLAFRWLKV